MVTLETDLIASVVSRSDWQQEVLVRLCRQESIYAEVIAERLISGVATPLVP